MTPFQRLKNFEPNVLKLIDTYLEKDNRLCNTHHHYYFEHGISNDARNSFKSAVIHNEIQIVKSMTNNRRIRVDKDEGLCIASESGHLDLVKYFVSIGSNVWTNENYPFRSAAQNGHLKVVQYLASVGADTSAKNHHAFRCARENGHVDVLKFILSSLHFDSARKKLIFNYGYFHVRESKNTERTELVNYLKSIGGYMIQHNTVESTITT